nr:NUDIX hydrolase [Azospirillum soli]
MRSFGVPHKTGNPWTILTTKPIYENPWMKVVEHDVLNPKGNPGIYGVMHAQHLATGVVPIDDDGCITLVGQYRFPLGQYSWEIPEGGGKKGVDPLVSVQRELLEETGQTARHWLPILTLHLSNSITDETAYCYLAWGLEHGEAEPEETEELQLRRVPFAEAYAMAMRGDITDAIAVASLLKVRLMALEGELPEDVTKLILG